jgi:hypothetical protein
MEVISDAEFKLRCVKRSALSKEARIKLDSTVYAAASTGDHQEIVRALEEGASANTRDPETGRPPLAVAATKEAVLELLKGRARPDMESLMRMGFGDSGRKAELPIATAIADGRVEVAQAIFDAVVRVLLPKEGASRAAAIKTAMGERMYQEIMDADIIAQKRGYLNTHAWVQSLKGEQKPATETKPARQGEPSQRKSGRHASRPPGSGNNYSRRRPLGKPHR